MLVSILQAPNVDRMLVTEAGMLTEVILLQLPVDDSLIVVSVEGRTTAPLLYWGSVMREVRLLL